MPKLQNLETQPEELHKISKPQTFSPLIVNLRGSDNTSRESLYTRFASIAFLILEIHFLFLFCIR